MTDDEFTRIFGAPPVLPPPLESPERIRWAVDVAINLAEGRAFDRFMQSVLGPARG